MNTERVLAVAKDTLLFLGGLSGIGYQQISGDVNTTLLVVFVAMTGVPGLTSLIALVRGPLTGSQPSSSASPSADSDSPTGQR